MAFIQPSFGAYVWVDDQGVTHMTDYPKPSQRPAQKEEEPASTGVPTKKDVAPVEVKQDAEQAVSRTSVPTQTTQLPVSAVTSTPAAGQPGKAVASVPTVTTQPVGLAPAMSPSTSPQPTPTGTTTDVKQEPRSEQPVPPMSEKTQKTLVLAFLAGLGMMLLLILVVCYIYFSLCLYKIAQKLDIHAAWTAWVPIVQVWTFLTAAGKSLAWVLLMFVPLVNIIVGVYLWMCITENLGRNKWLGLLMLIPLVNLVFLGILAFSAREA